MKKTSIKIKPVKTTSEIHNRREKKFDYVRSKLSHKNEHWEECDISDRLAFLKKIVKEKTGRKMQAKATPIREGVFLFDEHHSMKDSKKLARDIELEFGIKAIQIHMHRDEGRWVNDKGFTVTAMDEDGKKLGADIKPENAIEWIPNLHGHMVFDWMDHETGKSFKKDEQDMSDLQTLLAKSLSMKRGEKSSKKHLNALQYKNMKEQEALDKVLEARKKIEGFLEDLDKQSGKLVALNGFKMVDKDKTSQNIKAILLDNKNLMNLIAQLQSSSRRKKEQIEDFERRYEKERKELKTVLTTLQQEKKISKKYIEKKLGNNKGDGGPAKKPPSDLEY